MKWVAVYLTRPWRLVGLGRPFHLLTPQWPLQWLAVVPFVVPVRFLLLNVLRTRKVARLLVFVAFMRGVWVHLWFLDT